MYKNWQEQGLSSFTAIRWYRVEEVIQYLHDLRRYIIYTPGKMSSAYMPMLQKGDSQGCDEHGQGTEDHGMPQRQAHEHKQGLPAKENQRFPSHEVYICEAIGEWGLKLDRLALMSSVMVNTNRLERGYSHVDTVGDLEEHVMVMLHGLKRMIVDRVDFVSRQQFEARYDLNWQAEEQEAYEQTPQQNHHQLSSISESINSNHVKREETSSRDTTGSGASTPQYRSMSSNHSDGTVDLTSNPPS
ncbi:hypothetical protein MAM1_0059d03742 [Mucor ambiguus]|uniref:Uncharacterized protein n=1 Tax=Mucor ambiguus TaxID=91626 RepID=A0A0C9MMF5_9FUNG|nr:hypothetical protein MAM1_0059d03742 [Mucor ambiguus]